MPPDIDGITFTMPLTIVANVVDADGTLLNVSIGGAEPGQPSLGALAGVEAVFRVEPSGDVVNLAEDALLDDLAQDIGTYHLATTIGDGETATEATSMINPLTANVEDATLTVEHLGLDDGGCEVVRATRHIGPAAVVEDLDDLLDQLDDPEGRPDAFADVGFEGAIVRTATYRFDHGIARVRSVESTEAWGIFGAGGVDTRVETSMIIDVTDR